MSDTSEQQTTGIRARTASDYGYPVHRSRPARARNADVYIWWPSDGAKVVACLNADVTPVTPQTLLRWMGVTSTIPRQNDDGSNEDDDDDSNEDDDDDDSNEDDEDDSNEDDDQENSEVEDDDSTEVDHNDEDGNDDDADTGDKAEVIEIRRVELEHRGVFVYALKPLEVLKDSDLIVPGIYGCFLEGDPPQAPSKRHPILPYTQVKTLAQIQTDQLGYAKFNYGKRDFWPGMRDKIIGVRSVPEKICAKVTMPHDTCVFTGAKNDPDTLTLVKLYWIFPPAQCRNNLNGTWDIPRAVVLTKASSYAAVNVLPMRTDVHELWIANELSVDVDDGYRIYTFTDAARRIEGLRRTLDAPKAAWIPFLREHLLHTVLLRVNGGDVMEDFGVHDWIEKNEKLAEGDLQDKVWREPIGEDAFRLLYVDGKPDEDSPSDMPVEDSDSEDN